MTTRAASPPGDLATFAVVLLLPLFLFRNAVFGGALYERDIHLLWHAQIEGFVRAVSAGAWPTWDPWIGFGQPMLANPNTQSWYPPTWLNLLMRPWTYYTLYTVAHLAWAGAGMYLLSRALGVSRGGARVASAVWMASGPLLSLASMWNHFAGAAWMPWVVATAVRLSDRPDARRACALGAALALQLLAGSPDMSAYAGVVVAAVLLAAVMRDRARAAAAARVLVFATLALGVAAGLAAAQWLPAVAAAHGSPRWRLDEATRAYWSLHPLGAFELLWPQPWKAVPLSAAGIAALHESREPFLSSIYLGLPALGLVAAARRARGRRSGLLAVIGAVAVLAALGRHTPLHGALVAAAPVLGLSRFPVKALPVAAMAWAALAGIGWDVWRDEAQRGFRGVAAAVAVALAGGVALVATAPIAFAAWTAGRRAPVAVVLAVAAPALAMIVLALARAARPARARVLAAAAAAVAAIEITGVHRSVNPIAPSALFRHRPDAVATIPAGARVYARVPQDAAAAARDDGSALARLPQGWTVAAALALAQQMSLEPLTAARWGLRGSFAIDYLNMQPAALSRLTALAHQAAGTPAFERLLRACGVPPVVTRDRGPVGALVPVAEFEGLMRAPVRVLAVPSALPRIFVLGSARHATDALALLDPAFDPSREVLLAEGAGLMAPEGFRAAVERVAERADRIVVEVALSHPGYLVVLDAFDPAWAARVDGAAASILTANHAFRAVAVPAGRHEVEMVYRPPSVRAGLAISVATALLLAAALATRRRGGAAL